MIQELLLLPCWVATLCILLGLCIGSFLNVVIYRLPKGESIVSPRSRCPDCGQLIRAWENIPLLSFLILRGRCSQCGTAISWRYPAIEAVTGLVFFLAWQRYGPTAYAPLFMLFGASLIAAAMIDFDHQIIPDEISVGGFLVGMALAPVAGMLTGIPYRFALGMSFYGALLGGGLLWIVGFAHARLSVATGRQFEHWPGEGAEIPKINSADYWLWFPGMGLGDVKLFAMIGAFLGPFDVIEVLIAAAVVGLVFGVSWGIVTRRWSTPLGFGPAITIAAVYVAMRPVSWGLFELMAHY